MSTYSRYNVDTDEYEEGRIGECQCPNCGWPMLGEFDLDGNFLRQCGHCPVCNEGEI